MIAMQFEPGATTASTPISITSTLVTNQIIELQENKVIFKQPGIYELAGDMIATSGGAGNYGATLYVNDETTDTAWYNKAEASGETTTIPLYCVIKVETITEDVYAQISFIPIGAPTLVGGTVSLKKIV